MDIKYQVFVSSTFKDLVDERQEVIQALLELDCIPVGMELFPAADDDQWTLIQRLIDDCDYYILIIGGRYGSLNDKGISYTQMEYEYAVSKEIPVLSFLHKKPELITIGKSDNNPELQKKLETFKELAQKKVCKYYETSVELGSIVSRSLVKQIKDKPRTGWIKADNFLNEESAKELIDLRLQVDTFKRQLFSSDIKAPKGTEDLSQGDDFFKIDFSHRSDWDQFGSVYSGSNKAKQIELTWNQIFAVISPLLIDEAKELSLTSPINDLITKTHKENERKEAEKSNTKLSPSFLSKNYALTKEAFHTIIIQFKALGLITMSDKKRSIKDNGKYWTLTFYGENLMTKLRSIKRE